MKIIKIILIIILAFSTSVINCPDIIISRDNKIESVDDSIQGDPEFFSNISRITIYLYIN